MSIADAITSYHQLMTNVFSEPKRTLIGGTGAFRATVLEEELKTIVEKATGNRDQSMMDQDSADARCKV
jgi:hypothetical protein